jgi:hypothetical protein
MIKLIGIESLQDYRLLLRFSDGSAGVYDFARFVEADTPMTKPLRDPAFFARHFVELGALVWPNGFDLSAASLHRTLAERGELRPATAAA